MFKRFTVAVAALFVLGSSAFGAGTIPGFSLAQQLDTTGVPLSGCKLYTIQAGTTSTPQNAYQDSGLTLLLSYPVLCDAYGRLPQIFLADGSIKLILKRSNGTQVFELDGVLVVGASSGGGGGSPVDATTVLATGDVKYRYGNGVLTGFVRLNGRTIGSATSGGTERANADTQTLFEYLWNTDANLSVSTGRGASSAADWGANKTIALPDLRGRVMAGLDDMGNSAAGRLISTWFGSSATTLGVVGGSQLNSLTSTGQLPAFRPSGSIINGTITQMNVNVGSAAGGGASIVTGGFSTNAPFTAGSNGLAFVQSTSTFTGVDVGSNSPSGFGTIQPTMLVTFYIKL